MLRNSKGRFVKGCTPWNTGKKLPLETRRKIGEANKGKRRDCTPWNKGKKLGPRSLGVRRKISEACKGRIPWNKGKKTPKRIKKKISESMKGLRNSPKSEFKKGHVPWNKGVHVRLNTGKTHFKKGRHPSPETEFKKGKHSNLEYEFQNLTIKEYQEIKKKLSQRPTSLERKFIRFNQQNSLGFEYVGDGAFFIGRRNPDFVNRKERKIVEIFGNFWHSPEDEREKIEFYKKHGWDCIVIWEDELERIIDSGSSVWIVEGGLLARS